MKATVTIVMATRKGAPDQGIAFTVDSKLDLGDARKAIRRALTGEPATVVVRAKKALTPKQQARQAEKARLEAERATRRAARTEKQREKDRARAEREAKRKERQEKKDAAAARKAARNWVKGLPAPGDAVEYQEKPKGRRHVGRVKSVVDQHGTGTYYRIAGDKGVHLYPEWLVKRTLKPVR